MSRRRNRNALQRLVRAELQKGAPDFDQTMTGTPGGNAGAMLARYQKDFAGNTAFGPGVPGYPQVLDNTGEPRTFQYRTGWNIPSSPGEGRPLSMATLRSLADTYDLLRKGIEIRKDELCTMRFDIVARDTDRKRAREVVKEQQDTIVKIRDFFSFPDRQHSWQAWLRMVLEDYFVVDAATIWKWRTIGGKLLGLRVLDGALIKPLLSIQGTRPLPPDPAYQQILMGVNRWAFTSDELIYAPKNVRAHSAYGSSPVEQFILHINEALRYQRYVTDIFTDGTLPEGVAEAPASWTPQQLQEFNEYWDRLIAGDSRQLHKLQFVPAGFKWHQFKTVLFDLTLARWLVGVTAAALDLTPTELGFEPMGGGLGGKGFAEEQGKVLERKANGPLRRWLCDELLNPVIWNDFHAPDLQAVLLDPNAADEVLSEAQATDLDVRNGTRSIDQIVEEGGGEPPGIGRIFVFGNSVYGEPDLVTLTTQGAAALAEQLAKANAAALPPPTNMPNAGNVPGASAGTRQVAATTAANSTQARTEQKEQGPARQSDTSKSAVDDEIFRFFRFAEDRQSQGKQWRDFQSDLIPETLMTQLNKVAKAGGSSDALRSLIGLDAQPKRYREGVARTERAYRGLTTKLAARIGELVEAHA